MARQPRNTPNKKPTNPVSRKPTPSMDRPGAVLRSSIASQFPNMVQRGQQGMQQVRQQMPQLRRNPWGARPNMLQRPQQSMGRPQVGIPPMGPPPMGRPPIQGTPRPRRPMR